MEKDKKTNKEKEQIESKCCYLAIVGGFFLRKKLEVGTLVFVLVKMELLDGTSVKSGDVGIIIDNDITSEEHFFSNFDYTLLINNIELNVFEDEIAIYI